MPAKVITYGERGWPSSRAEKRLWQHLAQAYWADYQIIDRWDEASIPDDYVVVGVDETGEETLDDFKHPEAAVYVFGRSAQAVLTQINCDRTVRIQTRTPSYMFSISAAAIVLEDRRRKLGTKR